MWTFWGKILPFYVENNDFCCRFKFQIFYIAAMLVTIFWSHTVCVAFTWNCERQYPVYVFLWSVVFLLSYISCFLIIEFVLFMCVLQSLYKQHPFNGLFSKMAW